MEIADGKMGSQRVRNRKTDRPRNYRYAQYVRRAFFFSYFFFFFHPYNIYTHVFSGTRNLQFRPVDEVGENCLLHQST
jgi:hypothetical protein